MVSRIEALLPGLRGTGYSLTSPADDRYNCIAWAAGATDRWWWPGDPALTYWPEGVPRAETLEAFRAAFTAIGFLVCDNSRVEPGFEKIAIFADVSGAPTHAARQLPSGRWSSKLGRLEDIQHALDDVAGEAYGAVVQLMKRPAPTSLPTEGTESA